MSKLIITSRNKGNTGIVIPGVLGDYAAPTFKPSKIITPKISTNSQGSGTPTTPTPAANQPQDERVVADNYQSLQNFDNDKIYEGLITYSKADKKVYVWTGEKNDDDQYVWEDITVNTSADAQPLTDAQQADLISIILGTSTSEGGGE